MMNLFVYTISAQQKELLAVLIFRNNSTTSSYTSRYYPEELCGILTTEFFNTNKFRLIERPRINEVIHEQRFQESNLSNRQIQSLGQILGVRKIITGECVFRSGTYSANVRMVDVQTGFMDISITSILEKENYGSDSVSLTDFLVMLAKDITRQILENY